jgi:outer membrane protein OmpA-like peptidoglycan-associated protein
MEAFVISRVRPAAAILGVAALLISGGACFGADSEPATQADIIQQLTPKAVQNTAPSEKIRHRGLGISLDDPIAAEPAPAPVPAAAPNAKPAKAPPAAVKPPPMPSISFQMEFEYNSDVLTAKAMSVLDMVGGAVTSSELRGYRFRLAGHTDAAGSDAYNLRLSKRRAESARTYLISKFAIPAERLEAVGFGSRRLADAANPKSGANRRVEITNIGRE